MKHDYDDGYAGFDYGYDHKGGGRLDRWKWLTLVSLGLSVILTVSFVFYVVLHSSTPVNVEPQGEYWRTHENTRLGDDEIDKWIKEYLGEGADLNNDDIQFDFSDEQIDEMANSLFGKLENIDINNWLYLTDDNIFDFLLFNFEPLYKFDGVKDELDKIFYADDIEPRSGLLISFLSSLGLSQPVINAFMVCWAAIKVGIALAAVLVGLAIIAAAIAALTYIIIDNWDKISAAMNRIVQIFVDAFGIVGDAIRNAFNDITRKANREAKVRFEGVEYFKKVLDISLVAEIRGKKNINNTYIVLGAVDYMLIIAVSISVAMGGITDTKAITIMRNGPGVYFNPVGSIVVSIYTSNGSKARSIAQQAGDNMSPKYHRGAKRNFDHYHNGVMFNRYPHTEAEESNKKVKYPLPHAFYGYPRLS